MRTIPDSGETRTFVVRLWPEADAAGQRHWRGRVEQIETQQVDYVESIGEVADCIGRWVRSGRGHEQIPTRLTLQDEGL